MEQTLSTAIAIIALLISAAGLVWTIVKGRSEVDVNVSTTIKTYVEIAEKYSLEVDRLRERLDKAEQDHEEELQKTISKMKTEAEAKALAVKKEMEDLNRKVNYQGVQITELLIQKDKLERWARALVAQVDKLGGIPAAFPE